MILIAKKLEVTWFNLICAYSSRGVGSITKLKSIPISMSEWSNVIIQGQVNAVCDGFLLNCQAGRHVMTRSPFPEHFKIFSHVVRFDDPSFVEYFVFICIFIYIYILWLYILVYNIYVYIYIYIRMFFETNIKNLFLRILSCVCQLYVFLWYYVYVYIYIYS